MNIEERIGQIENTDECIYNIRNNLYLLCKDLVDWLKNRDYSKDFVRQFVDEIGSGNVLYVPFDADEFQARRSLMYDILDKLKTSKDSDEKECDKNNEFEHKQVLRALYFYGIFGTHEFYNRAALVVEGHNIMSNALKMEDLPYKSICIDRFNIDRFDSDFASEKLLHQNFPMNGYMIFNGAPVILAVKMYKEFNGVAA